MCCIRLDYPLKLPIGVLAAATMTTSFIRLCDELENVLNEILPKEAMSASLEFFFAVLTFDTFFNAHHFRDLKLKESNII